MIDSVQYGSKIIEFELEFIDRKTLGISVMPEMNIVVKAPVDIPLEKIREKILHVLL